MILPLWFRTASVSVFAVGLIYYFYLTAIFSIYGLLLFMQKYPGRYSDLPFYVNWAIPFMTFVLFIYVFLEYLRWVDKNIMNGGGSKWIWAWLVSLKKI